MNAKKMLRGCVVVACVSWALLPCVTHAQDEAPAPLLNYVTFGGQWWDQTNPEAKFQEFREMPRGGFIEGFKVSGERGRKQWEFSGANVLRGDQTARLSLYDGIKCELKAGYVQTPHNFSFITRSPYTLFNQGGGVFDFTLPDSFQAWNEALLNVSGSAATAAGARYNARVVDLLKAASLMPIGFRTDVANAKLSLRPAKGLQLEFTGERRDRRGSKPYSAAFGFSGAMEVWEPMDQRMLDGGVGLTYTAPKLVVRAEGGLSAFRNYASTLQWDNPRRLTGSAAGNNAGSGYGQLDLYPDNKAARGTLSLAYSLPKQTTFTALAGLTHMTQDDPFLPFTVNQAVIDTAAKYPATPLAFLDGATSLGGKADATQLQAKLTTMAVRNLDATARADYYKYDNKTPVHEYGASVAYDQSYQKGPFETDPWGNSTLVAGADLEYTVVSQFDVGGTIEHRIRKHTYREVLEDGETVLIGEADLRPTKGVKLNGSFQTGHRKPSDPFELEDYENANGNFVEQPNLRRFDVGDRKQTKAKGGLSWLATEKFDFNAKVDYTKNDYTQGDAAIVNLVSSYGDQLGLELQKVTNVVAMAGIHPSDMLDLTAGYGYGKGESDMASKYSGAATLRQDDSLNWSIHTNDYNSYVFSNVEWWPVLHKVSCNLDYEFDASRTAYDMVQAFDLVSGRVVPWTGGDVPTITYRRHDVRFQLMVQALRDTDIGVRYGWQWYKAKDFSADNVPVVGAFTDAAIASTGIYLGDKIQNYKANSAALVITRRF